MKKILTAIIAALVVVACFKNVNFTFEKKEFRGIHASYSKKSKEIDNDFIVDKNAENNEKIMRQAVKIEEDISFITPTGGEVQLNDVTSGSGAVIYVNDELNYSLILTAYHVCESSYAPGDMPIDGFIITESRKAVITRAGKKLNAVIFMSDKKNDICVMEASGVAGEEAYMASFYPPYGATLTTAGAPLGEWDTGVVNVVSGIYAGMLSKTIDVDGLTFKNFIQWSIPTVGGMSGSAVYYNGRIISLVSAGTNSYANIGYGPNLASVDRVVSEAITRAREIDRRLSID